MSDGGPQERPGQTQRGLPRVLADTTEAGAAGSSTQDGAVWNLAEPGRDLDANVINLPPGDGIAPHAGADVDVLIHVLAGTGTLHTEADPVPLRAGLILWLPRGSRRGFSAGPTGLRYLTVHQHRPSTGLWPGPAPR